MFERLADLEEEFDALEARLSDIYAAGDQDAARTAGQRHAELKPIIDTFRELRTARSQLDEAREMLHTETDAEMREMAREEIAEKESSVADLEGRLKVLLLPKDPNDDKNVILEVRGAEGGEEANLFAGDLVRMYQAYAAQQRWKVEVLSSQPSDMGGFKEATFLVKGQGVWSRLKHEAGTHRVQRVPATESQGRIHTSAATVAVLPEAEEVDVTVDPNDLQIDVYRSTGPGGQSVNTTDSAVRITHRPSGIVVACQDEKSQLQNKDKAMRILRARLLQAEQQRQADELSSARRAQVGGGGRSEKIRTYNFKENRVTDHRVGLTIHKLDQVLAGDLDQLLDALVEADRAAQLAGAASNSGDTPDPRDRDAGGSSTPRRPPGVARRRGPVAGGGGQRPRPVAVVRAGHGRWAGPARALVERRVAGEPLQYVLGRWSFRGLDLLVDPRVLIPRPETEVVAEVAIDEARRRPSGRAARARSPTWGRAAAPWPWPWPPSCPRRKCGPPTPARRRSRSPGPTWPPSAPRRRPGCTWPRGCGTKRCPAACEGG